MAESDDASVDAIARRVRAITSLASDVKARAQNTLGLVQRSRELLKRRAARSWPFRLMLLAIGSTTLDGSDLTASDFQILVNLDRYLLRLARTEGDAAADQALQTVVRTLEGEEPGSRPQLH